MEEFEKYLKISEVAQILGLTEPIIRYLCSDGELESVKLGYRTIRIPASALKRFLDEKTRGKKVQYPACDQCDETESSVPNALDTTDSISQ